MRRRLMAALAVSVVGSPTGAAATTRHPEKAPIREVLDAQSARFEACRAHALRLEPKRTGRVDVTVTVGRSGTPTVDLPEAWRGSAAARCLTELLRDAGFGRRVPAERMRFGFLVEPSSSGAQVPQDGLQPLALELAPVWGFVGGASSNTPNAAAGVAGLLRVATLTWTRAYWTPAVLGYGWAHVPRDGAVLVLAGSEVGLVFRPAPRHRLRIGLGVGFGLTYVGADEQDLALEGVGFGLYPTVRYAAHLSERFFVGGGVRGVGVIPSNGGTVLAFLQAGWSLAE